MATPPRSPMAYPPVVSPLHSPTPGLPPLQSHNPGQVCRSRSQPRLSRPKPECPLEILVLQPVGTSDHYLERCYCYLCTCGMHVCPADLKKLAASPNVKTGPTHYRQDFQQPSEPQPAHPLTFPHPSYLSNSGKMDLRTTQQMAYGPPAMLPAVHHMQSYPKGTVKLVTRSSYQRDFPDWKPGEAVLFRSNDPPYRGNYVGFSGKTTYQDDFDTAGKPLEHLQYAKSPKRADPISALSDFYGQTSHKSEFRQPVGLEAGGGSPARGLRNRTDYFSPIPVSLTTTYRQEFKHKDGPRAVPFKRAAKRYASTQAFLKQSK